MNYKRFHDKDACWLEYVTPWGIARVGESELEDALVVNRLNHMASFGAVKLKSMDELAYEIACKRIREWS